MGFRTVYSTAGRSFHKRGGRRGGKNGRRTPIPLRKKALHDLVQAFDRSGHPGRPECDWTLWEGYIGEDRREEVELIDVEGAKPRAEGKGRLAAKISEFTPEASEEKTGKRSGG